MTLGALPRAVVHPDRWRLGSVMPAFVVVVLLVEDPGPRQPPRFTLRGWLADMSRGDDGEWRLRVMHDPCGPARLGNTLEARYRGTLPECPRVSPVEAHGPVPTGPWLDADRVVIDCGVPTEPDPCPPRPGELRTDVVLGARSE